MKTGQRDVPIPSHIMTLLKRIHDHTGNRKDGLVVRLRTGRKLSGLNLTWKNIREAVASPTSASTICGTRSPATR